MPKTLGLALSSVLIMAAVMASMMESAPDPDIDALGAVPIDRLVVYKMANVMDVYSGGRLVASFSIATGRGEGPKRREGDESTPEGHYVIDERHESTRFRLFLHISYPNESDRAAFRQGQAEGTIPRNAHIGGNVGIHGMRTLFAWVPLWLQSTAGCVVVENDVVEFLYDNVVEGATIVIYP